MSRFRASIAQSEPIAANGKLAQRSRRRVLRAAGALAAGAPTPGAFNDTLGRTLAQEFSKGFAPGSHVENRPGSGSLIGTQFVAKAPPDGHTLLIVAFPFALINSLHAHAKIDVTRDFAAVAQAGVTPNVLVVTPSAPWRSVAELIADAKARPGQIPYASTGVGSSNHLSMELFKTMAKVDLIHVPYKGSAPALTDLIGGQVHAMFDNAPNVIPHLKAGRLRALAVTSPKRSPNLPELPTVDEAGVPGYRVFGWFGVVAPAGTPPQVVARLNEEINRVLAMPEVRERITQAGVDVATGTPDAFAAHIRDQVSTWSKVVRDADIKPE
ncbi:MAG TPA: tripartite tricarboxylate transporter substrate binding protein [Burkholderiaceae bacterium]|nr:tripartite tricarboxylate transporter substrate binding protein [Burkholderiaceae bacterium]